MEEIEEGTKGVVLGADTSLIHSCGQGKDAEGSDHAHEVDRELGLVGVAPFEGMVVAGGEGERGIAGEAEASFLGVIEAADGFAGTEAFQQADEVSWKNSKFQGPSMSSALTAWR